jgi:hypothetical protein
MESGSLYYEKKWIHKNGEDSFHVLIELDGTSPEKQEKRAPLNIALVLDQSGSMHGRPIRAFDCTIKRSRWTAPFFYLTHLKIIPINIYSIRNSMVKYITMNTNPSGG